MKTNQPPVKRPMQNSVQNPAGKPACLKKWKTVALILGGTLIALVLLDFALAVSAIYGWIHPEKVRWESSPAAYGLDYYSFEIETEKGTVCGWKIAAQIPMDPNTEEWVYTTEYSDKTVVLASNYDSNREVWDVGGIDYIADLCAAGYNVITFDWTGSGYSEGRKNVFTLDKAEELKAVVSFAAEETKASFLAVQGIGFGCYPAAVAAAECEEVDGLILDSCYEDFEETFYGQFQTWSRLNFFPVKQTVRMLFPLLSGVAVNDVTLADPINALNGKAVLFIQGESDEIFGSADARHLLSLAQVDNDAELWSVPGANHLRARSYDSEAYLSRVSQFLTKVCDKEHTV